MSFSNKCLPSITESIMKIYSVTLGGFIFHDYEVAVVYNLNRNNPIKQLSPE